LKMKLSRSDGALSNAMPYAYKTKFKPQTNPQSKAPSATNDKNEHSRPTVAGEKAGAGAGLKTPRTRRETRPSKSPEDYGIQAGTVKRRQEQIEESVTQGARNKALGRRMFQTVQDYWNKKQD
jgi:hypothetical protein